MGNQFLIEKRTSLKSIIKKTTIPLAILLLILGGLMEVFLTFQYGEDLNRIIINTSISLLLVIIISVAATNHIFKNTYVRVYDDCLEINDVSKSYLRNSKIKYSDIKTISVEKDVLIIETDTKIRIMHLIEPYEIIKAVNKRIEESKS